MAARGIDPGPTHGVLLLPSQAFDGWVSVLTKAAVDGPGLVAFDGGSIQKPASGQAPLLFDATYAKGLPIERWTVIATGLDSAAAAAAGQYGLPHDQGVWVASRLLAGACGLSGARWILDADLAGKPIEILPGLSVMPPQAISPKSNTLAASQALMLFAKGPPDMGAQASWSPDLFSYDQRRPPLGPEPRQLDLTGTARILVFGPYVSLPPGLWRANIGFSIDQAATRKRFRLEWGDQASFATHRFRPDQAGRYALEIEHRWDAPAPSEMRLVLEEGAIDGALTFEGLHLERME